MTEKKPSLRPLFDEYRDLTGADICSGAENPNPNAGPEQSIYRFQDRSVRGYTAAKAHIENLLERARSGTMWDGRTIDEYQTERAAMKKAYADLAPERAAKERAFDERMRVIVVEE